MFPLKAVRYLLVCVLCIAVASCTTQKTEGEETTLLSDSSIINGSVADDINSNQIQLLNKIIGSTDDGVIRGIDFGNPISKVRSNEIFEIFEDSTNHLGYTFETEQLETIDVLYYFSPQGGAVSKITVDIYLNSDTATRQLWESILKRFGIKYGAPQKESNKLVNWKNSNVNATIEEVSVGKDYGLKLVFTPSNNVALASK
jgi:hypothetical protein